MLLDQLYLLIDKGFLDDGDVETLRQLSQHEHNEIRANVAKALVNADPSKAENILLAMLNDKDYLVRTDVCDSLCFNSNPQVLEMLKKVAVKDKVGLVRHYAILTIGDIVLNINADKQELLQFLKQRLLVEKGKHTKIAFYRTMYALGDEKYLQCLINQLKSVRYQNRCATVNTLRGIVNDKNKADIVAALEDLSKTEKVVAVVSSIERALNEIR